MTLREVLALPTEDLAALSDPQLDALLGDLIPQARAPDRVRAADKQRKDTMALAAKAIAILTNK